MMRFAKRCGVLAGLAGLAAVLGGSGLFAQAPAATGELAPVPDGVVSLAITFDAAKSNLTSSHSFWLEGGSADFNVTLTHGLGLTASVGGLDTGNSGDGVPLKLGVLTFGPSYGLRTHLGKHPADLFVHGLVGSVKAFNGVFPAAGGATHGANSLAAKAGGGVDLTLSPHLSVRLFEVNWLRTELPNATTNVQNDLVLSAGIVFHAGKH
jgi:hypothetical protein